MSIDQQDLFVKSANAAVDAIMVEISNDEVLLEFQKDAAGIIGDVRDIVIKSESIEWEIGLSVKHNHEAVKHSCLSHSLDFGAEWFGIPCSNEYWNDIRPIFDMLIQAKNEGIKWCDNGVT